MVDQKEAYNYQIYMGKLDGAKLKVVPGIQYLGAYSSTPYSVADHFMKNATDSHNNPDSDDFLKQKVELSEDRIGLILGEICAREGLRNDNLSHLYYDLLKVRNWRLERPYDANYMKDKTWMELTKLELQLSDQIRRELKDSAKDIAFPQKDLRQSLLEFKLQNRKATMLDIGDLEADVMGPDGSYQPTGDMYLSKDQP